MPSPIKSKSITNRKSVNSNGKSLTIRNHQKIRGLCYYDDGVWEPLHATHIKSGGRAYIEWIEEGEESYRLRLLYIKPQPDSAIVTICRDGVMIAGKEMWNVEMDRGIKRLVSEYWEAEQFRMDRLLEAIRIWLID